MKELLHRASEILEPVWTRLFDVARVRPVVGADETRLRIVRDKGGKTKNGRTFGARDAEGASMSHTSSPKILRHVCDEDELPYFVSDGATLFDLCT